MFTASLLLDLASVDLVMLEHVNNLEFFFKLTDFLNFFPTATLLQYFGVSFGMLAESLGSL